MAKKTWQVECEFAMRKGEVLPPCDARISRLSDWLSAGYGGSASATGRGWICRVFVDRDRVVSTIEQADQCGCDRIAECMTQLELPPSDLIRRAVIDAEIFHTQLEVFGTRELAQQLGITPQRLVQLRAQGTLPEPDAVLAATPIWQRQTVETFIWGWRRKPGPVPAPDVDMVRLVSGR